MLLVFGREKGSLRNIYASGGRGFLHDMLLAAGGANVLADVAQEAVQATTELVLARAPDVILELHERDDWTDADTTAAAAVWGRLAAVPAVKARRVHVLAGEGLVVPGPRVADGRRTHRRRAPSRGGAMKMLVSWSSGKDSAWMLHVLRTIHPGAAQGLLTTTNEVFDRVAMHGVRRDVLEAQAAAARLPLQVVPLPWPCSNEEYERRMGGAVDRAVADGFTHVAFGDLFLEDVRRYREERLAGTGLTPMFPLWNTTTTAALAGQMLDAGLQARLSTVDPRHLDGRSLAGSSTPTCSRSCPPRPTRAASAVSSTPASRPDRCSRGPSRWSSARPLSATASSTPTSAWPDRCRDSRMLAKEEHSQ